MTKSTEETVKVCDFRPLSIPYLDDRGKLSDSRVYSNLHLSIITENRLRATLDNVLRGISHLRGPFEVNESRFGYGTYLMPSFKLILTNCLRNHLCYIECSCATRYITAAKCNPYSIKVCIIQNCASFY